MEVAISGGSGFIGSRLVDLHLKLGDSVRILSRKKNIHHKSVRCFHGDLCEKAGSFDDFLDGVDVFYHCAAELKRQDRMRSVHIDGTQKLLNSAKGRVRRWVQLSSVGVYGHRAEGAIHEESPYQPVGTYETTKCESDQLVRSFCKKNLIPFSIVQPSNVIGVDMPNPVIRSWIYYLRKRLFFFLGKPGAMENYIPVEEVVRALHLCAIDDRAVGESFIVSEPIRIEEAASILCQALSIPPVRWRFPVLPVRLLVLPFAWVPGFPLNQTRINSLTRRMIYESKKIRKILGYSPKKGIDLALREIAATERR